MRDETVGVAEVARQAELRARDRTLLDARYEDGRSCRETAVACEIPPSLVKVRLFRARKRLQREGLLPMKPKPVGAVVGGRSGPPRAPRFG